MNRSGVSTTRGGPGLAVKRVVKRVSSTQPFNSFATTAVRATAHAMGRDVGAIERYLHHSGTTKAQLPNGRFLKLWAGHDEQIANIVFWHGWDGYEPEVSRVFYRLAARARTVIDVGAHVGFYSALAALVNPSARVYSLEPHPAVFARLERTLAVNEATNVRAFQLAAGAATGAGELLEPQSSVLPTMSTLSREFAQTDARHGVRSIPVRVVRLDDFVSEQGIERVELVKVDTETTEPDVLGGMSATLERDRPEIICEVLTADGGAQIQGLLAPLGYRSYLLTERGPELRDRVRPRPGADAYPDNYLFTIPGREALSSG